MPEQKIPKEERPDVSQLKNRRPKKEQTAATDHSVCCLGDLRSLVSNPPAGVTIFEDDMILSKDRVVLSFGLTEGIDDILREKNLCCCCLDFTFQTNRSGLLLGASGAVGLVLEKSGPAVRFLPTFFVLANLEDAFSQQLAAKLLLDKTEKLGVPMSHCFASCSCYNAVESLCAKEGRSLKNTPMPPARTLASTCMS